MGVNRMDDLISRQAAIDALRLIPYDLGKRELEDAIKAVEQLPSAQPDIIRCKDCKFYTAMNRKTKSGICSLIMHQNFGDDWYCAGAERRADG